MEELFGDFSLGLFFWQTALFIALVLLLKKYAWKPILDSVSNREDGIKNALDAAEKAKLEMQNLQADNQKLLKEARLERESMLKEARDMRNKMIEDAKDQAKDAATKLITQAKESIEAEKKAAITELKSQVATLSIDIAEKVVRAELSNKDKQEKLVESMLGDAKLN